MEEFQRRDPAGRVAPLDPMKRGLKQVVYSELVEGEQRRCTT